MSRLIEIELVKNMRAQRWMAIIAFALAVLILLPIVAICCHNGTISGSLERVLYIVIPFLSVHALYPCRSTDNKLLAVLLKHGNSRAPTHH